MWIVYALLLASALTLWTVFGRFAPAVVQYHDSDVQSQAEIKTATVLGDESSDPAVVGGDRSSNLKFVTALKKSSIWTDVRSRSATISTRPRLDGLEDKSPEDLSDQDLSTLKQAYHDALKCVAVDQLLVLKSVTEATDTGSKVTVRMAIVKITKVLTEYTTEYHEDVYRYEEVTVSDDEKKVNNTVTAILEDNRELCLPGAENGGGSGDSGPDANSTSNVNANQASNEETNAATDGDGNAGQYRSTTKNLNLGDQNFGTINNYDWNFGTVNEATINAGGQQGDQGAESATNGRGQEEESATNGDGQEEYAAVGPEARGTGNADHQPQYGAPDDGGAPDLGFIFSTDEGAKTGAAEDKDGAARTKASRSRPADDGAAGGDTTLLVDNGRRGGNRGTNDSRVDVASAGSNNAATVKKGTVNDGYLNNGEMKVYNINRGVHNRGNLKHTDANGGIVSVGTVNNGPINFGTTASHVNNGTETTADDVNVQRFATSVDQAYTDILRRFAQ